MAEDNSPADEPPQMSDGELYAFDLRGYIVVRNALSPRELEIANAAIDRMGALSPSPVYSGGSKTLDQGTGSHGRVCH
jgi:hypothetical protein